MSSIKSQYREQLKARRAALTGQERALKSREIIKNVLSLSELEECNSVFCFVSYGTEVQTHTLIERLVEQHRKIAVPSIVNKNQMLAREFDGWESLEKDKLGILSPAPSAAQVNSVDITLTPGLGFTPRGHRIGYGRGYYDRWFSKHLAGVKIALAYDVQVCEELPVDDYDVKVDIIVTESTIFRP